MVHSAWYTEVVLGDERCALRPPQSHAGARGVAAHAYA